MKIIDGKTLAENLRKNIANEVKQYSRPPGLAVLLVGDDQASQVYVRNKSRACVEVGFYSDQIHKSANITQEELLSEVQRLNENNNIDGILVQLPLPSHIDANEIIEAIIPEKDVDGFSSENVGKLSLNKPFISPCTPKGVIKMLDSIKCDLRGKDCVIIGASNIVGRPMAMEFLNAGATVQVCHKETKEIKQKAKSADIIVAAAGVANLVNSEWVKEGAVIIDVGINRLEDGSMTGDVDFDDVKDTVSAISPVPGGVGPMTIAVLLENTLTAYQAKL
ncbi:bifunctional methylenetetrahydrofolate dehydrogenase/methenyltetrahydrofolate cyclohydrolase FolD [Candidatus Pseudothioglobus singularis]|jgi:methylenetetrahydrofolate dehydrogenase (NADP+)/methenyltetrahydrofolate cyclohydrolase|nr:bifunctional methylenetetrahydrofolate dehydrogenase/methenyltetrahydrofolate cyclohydrolase FolD [Candidatus Pseudothioglobus singularis]MDB2670344.1 bifunctional methylenetetrahydrofolate dehydrogenase/methenyltetrahydrofolate cyclohydrolase FolD [Candidatus Pseudothioglobus singularis]MDG1345145.1 bifunctional methylenetetrahydrofolate dehydrogenase/methenyltetrahydrofolate cyclohydrolase FolD [Candidatus Thioglobus sp.]